MNAIARVVISGLTGSSGRGRNPFAKPDQQARLPTPSRIARDDVVVDWANRAETTPAKDA